jgi:hypothetical protein
MTISSTTNTVSYNGNASTTAFAVPYAFFGTGTTSEIQVVEVVIATGVETVKSNGSDYTVAGGSGTTGTVTATVAPASTVKWVINRATTQTQETDYVENDPFPAESHEEALDRLTAIDQEQQRALDRTAQLPDGYTGVFDPTLPTTITGSTVLAFNAGATAFEVGPTTTQISAAQGYATAAAASETAAAASETAAAASETAAAASETAAGLSETAAAASETAAAASETAAAASETAAAASETAAAASETAAGLSETAAAASETAAGLSETAAGTSETNAATSASNAATSETNAATSASNAATSETNAAASEAAAAASAAGFTITSISDQANSSTGWLDLPSGNDAQRGSPTSGAVRYNTDDSAFEGYDGSAWGALGGGNTSSDGLWENAATISADYTISVGNNALSAGPITVGSGVTVTVPSGSTWTVI